MKRLHPYTRQVQLKQMNRACLILTMIIIGCSQGLIAQLTKETLLYQEMKRNPDNYSSEDRIILFQNHLLQYTSNADTSFIILKEGEQFGKSIRDSLFVGYTYSSKGALFRMIGQRDSALVYHKLAASYSEASPSERASSFIGVGAVYKALAELDSALLWFKKAEEVINLEERVNDKSNLYNQMGQVYQLQGKYQLAIDYFEKALEHKDDAMSPIIATNVLKNLGDLYLDIQNYTLAEENFVKAYDICVANDYKITLHTVQAYRARGYTETGKHQAAIELLEPAIAYFTQSESPGMESFSRALLVTNLLATGDHDKTTQAYESLQALHKQNPDKNLQNNYYYMYACAGYHLSQNNTKECLYWLDAIERKATPTQLYHWLTKAKDMRYQLAFKNGDLNAMNHYKQAIIDDMKAANEYRQTDIILAFDAKNKKAEQDQLILKLEQERNYQTALLQNQKERLFLLYLIGALLIAGLISTYLSYRSKARINATLNDKNNQLSKALEQNKLLIKEIHHRVKNNLQVVSSLLNLQSRFEKNDSVLQAINTGKYRVQSMSLLHKNLYENENLKEIKIGPYFEELTGHIVNGYTKEGEQIDFKLQVDDLSLDIDTVVPMGLIVNELITNAIKYAKNASDQLTIRLEILDNVDNISLSIQDNGSGLPFDTLPKRSRSMGMQLISSFVQKLKGNLQIDNSKGANITIIFPKQLSSTLKTAV